MTNFLSQLKKAVDITIKIGAGPSLPTDLKDRITAFAYSISVDKLKKDYPEEFEKVSMEIIEGMKGKDIKDIALETSTKLGQLVVSKLGTDGLKKLIEKLEDAVEDYYN